MTFHYANRVKLAYITDAYCVLVDAQNPLATYAMARSLLEFHALVAHVAQELKHTKANGRPWKERAEKFFKILARARYGSSDNARAAALVKGGVPEPFVKPIHTNDCLRALTAMANFDWVQAHYDTLCDYVHQNVASQALSATSLHEGAQAEVATGLTMLLPEAYSIIRYQYGSEIRCLQAIESTAPRMVTSIKGALDVITDCPSSPFSAEELKRLTGTDLGFGPLPRGFSELT